MKNHVRWLIFGCLLWVLLPAGAVQAQTPAITETFKLTAGDGQENDYFGISVAISGDVIVVGAPEDQQPGPAAGSAYVYRFDGDGWVEEAKLMTGIEEGYFGESVAAYGDVIVVGARGIESLIDGHAFVYRFDGDAWAQEADLVTRVENEDEWQDDDFGISVAVSQDVIVVGADQDNHAGPNTGAAYVYRFDGAEWALQARLTAGDAAANARFGQAVAVNGNVIVVGAYGDAHAGEDSGAAYVYRFSGGRWTEEAKLTAGDAAPGHNFGYRAVSVDAEVIVIGAYVNSSAYVFRFDGAGGWVEEQRLSDAAAGSFGQAVSIHGEVIAVGAFVDHAPLSGSGSAYVFRFDGAGWVEQAKLIVDDAAPGDMLGTAVALDGDVVVVGAAMGDGAVPDSGAAYVFQLSPPDSEPPPPPPPGDGNGDDDAPPLNGGSGGGGCFISSAFLFK